MQSILYFRRLFAHDAWANREILRAFRASDSPPAKSLRWMGHILSAERLWFERLHGQVQMLPVWPDSSLEQCEQQAFEIAGLWMNYFEKLEEPGLDTSVTYKNSAGEAWTSRTEDILTHLMMHSVYHRGQIAADLRATGLTPPNTDFIHAVRSKFIA